MRTSLRLRLLAAVPAIVLGAGQVGSSQPGPPTAPAVQENYANLPLAFEPNAGQADPQVRFLTRSHGMTIFFTDNEAVMVLQKPEKTAPDRLRRHEVPRQDGDGGGAHEAGRRAKTQTGYGLGEVAGDQQLLYRQRPGEVAHGYTELCPHSVPGRLPWRGSGLLGWAFGPRNFMKKWQSGTMARAGAVRSLGQWRS